MHQGVAEGLRASLSMYAYIAHIEFVGRAALIRVLSIFTLIEVKPVVPRDDHHHALTRNGFLNDSWWREIDAIQTANAEPVRFATVLLKYKLKPDNL